MIHSLEQLLLRSMHLWTQMIRISPLLPIVLLFAGLLAVRIFVLYAFWLEDRYAQGWLLLSR